MKGFLNKESADFENLCKFMWCKGWEKRFLGIFAPEH